ncbi:hypothetical protein QR680_007173 [Steinernema hermaphroditum]|uniref:Replication protein A subunit n=1 Tax=Steinernema hermaphroditum TaxID=289476 RepID=A0AA39LYE1_9BILA|nr:hypothetical protein QR680_007173 [Steinernema hermaphroditum]
MDSTSECGGYTWQQSWKLLRPVMINMLLTLAMWLGVYDGKSDANMIGMFMLNSDSEHTTGSDLYDGLLNGIGSVVIIGLVSFVILALAMFDLKRIVELWISGSCLAVLYGVSGMFLYDLFRQISLPYPYAEIYAIVNALSYGTLGYQVFFTRNAEPWLHQLYVITNCSLVSVFYLRMFPVHTAWFVLLFIIGWDWFAVLTPYGPLHLVQEKAADYSQDILKFLMFSADSGDSNTKIAKNVQAELVLKSSPTEADSDSENDSTETAIEGNFDDEDEMQTSCSSESMTAFDAFHDDRVRLGMGDFVFYGVLVGKAACSGSILATTAAYSGVCIGLLLTLMVVFKRDDTVPALPNSIALGMLFHFAVIYGYDLVAYVPTSPSKMNDFGLDGTPTVSHGTNDVTPIALITPYVSRWRVCGITSQKTSIRNVKSAKGEFRVFSFTITDKNGNELRASAFGEIADRLHDFVQEGQMYYIRGSPYIVKAADKRYNSTGHDYEITIRNDADVSVCTDRAVMKAAPLKLNVRPLNKIGAGLQGQGIDVLAIVEKVDEPSDVTVRSTGNIIKKRNVYLVDDSNTMVQLTIWNDKAVEFNVDPGEHPVIGIKNAQVSEYNGNFSLSAGDSTRFELNPECDGADDLAMWYANEKPGASITSLSASGGGANFSRDLLTIGMSTLAKVGENEYRGVYFNVVAIINNVRSENIVYKACATEGCKKKVQEMDGQYRCEKCDITRDSFKYVLMMGCELADATGSRWVTIFEEKAGDLLKISADELGILKESDTERFIKVIDEVRFRPFHFRIRARTETFNDMENIRWSVYDVKPVPYTEYINMMRDTLQKIDTS